MRVFFLIFKFLKDLGPLKVWKKHGEDRPEVNQWKKAEYNQVYTAHAFISLLTPEPILFNIFPGHGNGDNFVDFFLHIYPYIPEDSVVVLDNCLFHTNISGIFVKELLATKNVEYILLPPYSPELNPIELVFSFLKKDLRKKDLRENLPASFCDSIAKVSFLMLQKMYKHCGYFK